MNEEYEIKKRFTLEPEVIPGHCRVGDHTIDALVSALRGKLPFHVYEARQTIAYKDGEQERTLDDIPQGIALDQRLQPMPKRYAISSERARHKLHVTLRNDERDKNVDVEIVCSTEFYMAQRDERTKQASDIVEDATVAIMELYTPHAASVRAQTKQEVSRDDDCY